MTEFCPFLWPEDATPKAYEDCQECSLFTHGSRMVWGEGNPNAPIMIILDNPGSREDKEGNPTVCGTRETLQNAANQVGLDIEDLYVTFILKRRPRRKYDKEETREICMQHLHEQLHEKQPKLIFCMGNIAVQSFFRNPESDVKSLRGKIHIVDGHQTAVAYHPLAVRRRPNLWPMFLQDWNVVEKKFRDIMNGS